MRTSFNLPVISVLIQQLSRINKIFLTNTMCGLKRKRIHQNILNISMDITITRLLSTDAYVFHMVKFVLEVCITIHNKLCLFRSENSTYIVFSQVCNAIILLYSLNLRICF